jgi:hypothetical protein
MDTVEKAKCRAGVDEYLTWMIVRDNDATSYFRTIY